MLILAPSVIGSGDIKADGGSSGGSGGRIAIKDLTSEFVFDGSISVDGGSTSAGAGACEQDHTPRSVCIVPVHIHEK